MPDFNSSEVNKSANFSQELLISAESYIAVAFVLFLIGFFGFFLNLSVIVFMWKKKQLWTPINIILFNLVVSDFLVSILGNPWTFVSAINYRWVFGKTGCVLYGFIMSLLGITSITTLTVLAFERYLIIARPFRNKVLNFRSAYLLVTGIWIYSLSLTLPPLAGWGEYVSEAADISCSVNWEEKSLNSMTYILYLFTLGLFVPLVIITFSYVNIIVRIRRNAFRMGQVTKAERKVAYMILIMIVAFLTAWTPYAVLALIIQFGNATSVSPGVAVLPALLAKSSICYNPVIYIGLNVQFQHTWRQAYKSRQTEYTIEGAEASRVFSMDTAMSSRNTKSERIKIVGSSGKSVYKLCQEEQPDVTMI